MFVYCLYMLRGWTPNNPHVNKEEYFFIWKPPSPAPFFPTTPPSLVAPSQTMWGDRPVPHSDTLRVCPARINEPRDAIWACVIGHGTCALSSSPPVRRVFKPVWFGLSFAPITPSPVHSNGLYVRCVPPTGMFGSLLCVNGCCVLASYSPIRFILCM